MLLLSLSVHIMVAAMGVVNENLEYQTQRGTLKCTIFGIKMQYYAFITVQQQLSVALMCSESPALKAVKSAKQLLAQM